MDFRLRRLLPVILLAGLFAHPHMARAAESFDNCNNFIETIPATISTQGVWCLRHDLATNIASGYAIEIAANNVTVDCNDFKLGGLAAGNASGAVGIHAYGRQNTTIRHCNIRGFYEGIDLSDGDGNLLEDNRLDNNLWIAIYVDGSNTMIRRNRVYDTGGKTGGLSTYGIDAAGGDVIDNTVSGLFVEQSGGLLFGIVSTNSVPGISPVVRGNKVGGFDMAASSGGNVYAAYAISTPATGARVDGNHVSGPNSGTSVGINAGDDDFCLGNTATGFGTNIISYCNSAGNLAH
jgi:parallel beta-helix repeat protein